MARYRLPNVGAVSSWLMAPMEDEATEASR